MRAGRQAKMSTLQLMQLFKARDPPEFMKPYPVQLGKKKATPYTGMAQFTAQFETPEEYANVMETFTPIEQASSVNHPRIATFLLAGPCRVSSSRAACKTAWTGVLCSARNVAVYPAA